MNSDFILIYIQRLDKCANCYEKGEKKVCMAARSAIVNESLDLAFWCKITENIYVYRCLIEQRK